MLHTLLTSRVQTMTETSPGAETTGRIPVQTESGSDNSTKVTDDTYDSD